MFHFEDDVARISIFFDWVEQGEADLLRHIFDVWITPYIDCNAHHLARCLIAAGTACSSQSDSLLSLSFLIFSRVLTHHCPIELSLWSVIRKLITV